MDFIKIQLANGSLIHYTTIHRVTKDPEHGRCNMRAKIKFMDHGVLDYKVIDYRYPRIGEYYIHNNVGVLAQVELHGKRLIVQPVLH